MINEMVNSTTEKTAAAGPKLEKPPVIDGRVDITFDNSGMLANMIMFPPQNGGRPITMELVAECLASKGIVAGVDEFDIRDMLDNHVYETFVCIARAIPPKNGANGYVDYKYEKTRVVQPKKDEFGVTNYRELDTILQIRRGDIIADIIPPTEGEPGLNIFGEPIPPEPGKPAKVTVGKNSVITADSLHIIAACDGHIKYGVGCFNVEDTVVVHSDLDLTVGNIDFFGDVHIKGNVMEGFSVKAGKNLKVDGSIYSSDITAGGSVTVAGGIISSTINAEGNVTADFFHNSNITAKGTVSGKEFAFCEVFCYGELIAKGPTGVICGGKITAMRDITAGIIGSNKYTQTEINIGDGSVLFARRKQAEKELEEINEAHGQSMRNLEFLKQRREQQGGRLSEAQAKQYKVETQNKIFYGMKKKTLTETIAQLDEEIKHKDALSARCTGVIYPGSHFCINFLTLEVTEMYRSSSITILGDQLAIIPFR